MPSFRGRKENLGADEYAKGPEEEREIEEREESEGQRIGRRGADGWESDPKGLGNGICSVCARPCVCKCPTCVGTQVRESDG